MTFAESENDRINVIRSDRVIPNQIIAPVLNSPYVSPEAVYINNPQLRPEHRIGSEHKRKCLKFLGVAKEIAKLSKDRSTQVGAVALGPDYEILGVAYNGFPRGINDDVEERHERPTKYLWTSHGEENLVATAARTGVSLKGSTILITALFPCTTCSRLMIQSGVCHIVAPKSDNPRWVDQAKTAMEMLVEAGIKIHYYDNDAI